MTKTPDKLSCILEKFHNKAIDIQKLSFEEWGLAYDNLEIQAIKSIEELFNERFKEALGEEKSPKGFIKECEHCKNCIFIVCYKTNKITYEVKKLIRKRWQESKEGE